MTDTQAQSLLYATTNPKTKKFIKAKFVFAEDPTGQGFFWPTSEEKRLEALSIRRNAPSDFEAIYQGRPGAREGSVFLDKDIKAFFALENQGVPFPHTELLLGLGSPHVRAFVARGHATEQAWDTAFSTTLTSAWTVGITGLFVPCQSYHCGEDPATLGPCDFHFDVMILDVYRRRIDFADLTTAVRTNFRLWNPHEVVIEKKASGIDAIAALKNSNIPITPVTPADGKRQRAVNSVGIKSAGSVQGWFRQHRVLTPVYAPWLDAWQKEMKDFSGNDDTSSDQVDATVHLVTRAIILGSSGIILPADWTPERSAIPGYMLAAEAMPGSDQIDPRMAMLMELGALQSNVEDPFWGTCSRCFYKGDKQPCPIMGRKMLAVDSCDQYTDAPSLDINANAIAFRNA